MNARNPRWLVTGAGGMLGRDLVASLDGRDVTALRHAELDITDASAVADAVRGHDIVVNCAAWTDVDGAESQEDSARAANVTGPSALAQACATSGARLLHISTDYVFDGDGKEPYDEADPTGPVSVYGRTKLDGEEAVLSRLPEAGYVVRTAWLYGEHGRNFITTMMRLEGERDTIDVVDDQRGQPTWARDLARILVAIGDSNAAPGVYHATSGGETTWFGLARALFELIGADPDRVRPTTTDRFPRPAPRPAYSVLGHRRLSEASIAPIRDWHDALTEAVPVLRSA